MNCYFQLRQQQRQRHCCYHQFNFQNRNLFIVVHDKNLDFAQQNIHQIQSQISCSLYPKCRCPMQVIFLDDWANKCTQQQFELGSEKRVP